ncbi:MAG: PAS domain S-box [Candidatus Magasanikbacteria bacterium]|nr:PAS domain S-box [Candidatus Magasanikbacteria bacterium]
MSNTPLTPFKTVEEAVRFYEAVFDGLSESFLVVDKDWTIICINQSAIPTGANRGEYLNQNLLDKFPHLRNEGVMERIERVFASGEANIELYVRRTTADGFTGYFHRKLLPLKIHGLVEAVIFIVDNVHEERLAQLHAKDAEFRYQQIVETMNLVSFRCDASGKFTYINNAVLAVFGFSPPEMLGTPFSQYVFPDDIGTMWRVFWQIVNQDKPFGKMENRIIARDGAIKYMRWNFHPVFDRAGKIVGSQGVGEDVTDQQAYISEVLASREKYRGLFNTVPSPLIIIKTDGEIVNVNRAACKFLRYPQQELLKRSVRDFVSEAHIFEDLWQRLHEKGRVQETLTFMRADQSRVRVPTHGTRFGRYLALILQHEV